MLQSQQMFDNIYLSMVEIQKIKFRFLKLRNKSDLLLTQHGLVDILTSSIPSWPQSLTPNVKSRPLSIKETKKQDNQFGSSVNFIKGYQKVSLILGKLSKKI